MCFAKQANLSQLQYTGAWCMPESKPNGCNLFKLPNQPTTRVIITSYLLNLHQFPALRAFLVPGNNCVMQKSHYGPSINYVVSKLAIFDPLLPLTLYWNRFCIVIWGSYSQNDRFVQYWIQGLLWYHIRSEKLPKATFVTKKLLETDRIG